MRQTVQMYIPTIERAVASGLHEARYTPRETLRLSALVVVAVLDGERGRKQLFETYVPRQLGGVPELFHFESTFEKSTTVKRGLPPEQLRCRDLKPVRTGGAYRAAQTEKQPDFHGFDFCDTIALATQSLERFFLGAGEAPRYHIHAYAWPLLWLRFDLEPCEIVLWVNRAGELASFVGRPPEGD